MNLKQTLYAEQQKLKPFCQKDLLFYQVICLLLGWATFQMEGTRIFVLGLAPAVLVLGYARERGVRLNSTPALQKLAWLTAALLYVLFALLMLCLS